MPRKPKQPTNNALLRQWAMLRMIPRAPRVIGTSDLICRLKDQGFLVDLRTIQRDLIKLSQVLPLTGDQAKPQGWQWLPRAGQFDIPGLEPQAALAFHMAEAHLQSVLPASTLATLQPWFETARGVLDEHCNSLAKWPAKVRVLPRGLPRLVPVIRPDVQSAVYQAVLLDCKLSIVYRRRADKIIPEHKVSPLALVVRDSVIYLVCVFDGYSDLRQLALHRIFRADMLAEVAMRPKGFSIDAYIAEGEFGIPFSQKLIRLEAEFLRHVAIHLQEAPIEKDQTITEVDNGRVLLRATVADTLELRQWLMSFGAEIKVIKPASLRREFRDLAAGLAHLYLAC